MLKIFCLFFFTVTTVMHAQNNSINWLNSNVHPLQSGSNTESLDDLHFLAALVKDKQIIGLGEASHGTSEFYIQKGRIVKYLVNELNYRLIAFEAPNTAVQPLNSYIQDGSGDVTVLLKNMGLYNSEEMLQLCNWLQQYNKTGKEKVQLIGTDREEFWSDPMMRDEWMALVFMEEHAQKKGKAIVWAHNLHIAKDNTMSEYNAMGFHLHQQFGGSFYVIGFDTYKGSVTVLDSNGTPEIHFFEGTGDTFSSMFAEVKHPIFFVDFNATGNPLGGAVNKITNLYSNWQTPVPLPIKAGSDFDALIFIRETTASKTPNQ